MKKILLNILAAAACFLSFSCEENFSPKAPFKEEYFIYSVITASNDPQATSVPIEVIILKTYDVEGYDPETNRTDPSVEGAIVTVRYKNRIDTLRQMKRKRTDTTRYNTSQVYYRLNAISSSYTDSIYITATVPGGKVLKASTTIPPVMDIEIYPDFNGVINPRSSAFKWGTKLQLSWDNSSVGFYRNLFFPRVYINYTKKTGDREIAGSQEVPQMFLSREGKENPVYASYTEGSDYEYELRAIDSAMTWISKGVADKSLFSVTGISISVTDFNRHLASYYASVNGVLDQFTIRLDELVYTNVAGGGGIWGSSRTNKLAQRLDRNYIKSFGYKAP